jgi:hypothetical protein
MGRGRKLAAFAALAAVAMPSVAFDNLSQPQPGIKFYFAVPLDARNAKEQTLNAGFAIQGRRDYETIRIDSGMINHFIGGGIEAKWIIAGVVAAGAVIAVASKDKSTTASMQQQQEQQAQQIAQQQPTGGGSGGSGGSGTCSTCGTCSSATALSCTAK